MNGRWTRVYKLHQLREHLIREKKMEKHMAFVMIDTETMGLRSRCPVITIGAVAYTHNGVFSEFGARLNLDEQFQGGRIPEQGAFEWWLKQSEEARQALLGVNRENVQDVRTRFVDWFATVVASPAIDDPEHVYVMANGNDFDLAILDDLWAGAVPWHFRKKICWRTLAILWRGEYQWPEKTVRHSALADAHAQAYAHLSLIAKYPERLSIIK